MSFSCRPCLVDIAVKSVKEKRGEGEVTVVYEGILKLPEASKVYEESKTRCTKKKTC